MPSKFVLQPTTHVVRGSLCTYEFFADVLVIIQEGISWMKNMVELLHFVIFQIVYKKLDDEVCLIWLSIEGLIIWGHDECTCGNFMNGGYDFVKLKKCAYITNVVFLDMG
jgi:hypothetical protein